MCEIMAIANQKGGVGKTTTTINLSAALAEKGKKVLVIDMDPQGNTSSGLGIDKDELEKTVYQLMIGKNTFDECVQKNVFDNLDVFSKKTDNSSISKSIVFPNGKDVLNKNNSKIISILERYNLYKKVK